MNAPPKGSCESVSNVSEACAGKQRDKQTIEWMAQRGHYRGVFSIDRPPLLAVMRRFILHPCFFNPAKLPRTLSGWYGHAAVFPETAFLQIATSNWKLPSSSSEPVRAVV
jgi:hypothetical protein